MMINVYTFIKTVLDIYDRYRDELGISDVYSFRTYGNFIKVMSMIVFSKYSNLTKNKPEVVTMYLTKDNEVIMFTDLDTEKLLDVDSLKCDKYYIIEYDIYNPSKKIYLIDISNQYSFIKDILEKFDVHIVLSKESVEKLKLYAFKRFKITKINPEVILKNVVKVLSIKYIINSGSVNEINKFLNIINKL